MRSRLRNRRKPVELAPAKNTTLSEAPVTQGSAKTTKASAQPRSTRSRLGADEVVSSLDKSQLPNTVVAPSRYNLRQRKDKQQAANIDNHLSSKAQAEQVSKRAVEKKEAGKKQKPAGAPDHSIPQTSPDRRFAKKDLSAGDNLTLQRFVQNPEEAIQNPADPRSVSRVLSDRSIHWPESEKHFISPFEGYGYEVPDSESMASGTRDTTPAQSGKSDTQNNKPRTIGPENAAFDIILDKRGVILKPRRHVPQQLESRILAPNDYSTTPIEEEEWARDLEKCGLACEAIFQHTIMMQSIDRHALEKVLDYTCEATWICPPLPIKDYIVDEKMVYVRKPKPDLSVAFDGDALIDDEDAQGPELERLYAYMYPEGKKVDQVPRAFPFFIMEVKGAASDLAGTKATRQCLNSASQALFNIWKFFEGENTEPRFFNDVRVFSATGHGQNFKIRIHWACKTPRDRNDKNIVGPMKLPLFFCHKELEVLTSSKYRKDRVIGIVKNILNYGTKDLLPLLREALETKLNGNTATSSPSSTRKRVNHSPNASVASLASTKKRQAMVPASSFTSTGSAGQRLDSTHIYESDHSFTEVAG